MAAPQKLMLGINNQLVPKDGPKTIPVLCELSTSQSVLVDVSLNQALAQLEFVQTLYIDNSQNPAPLWVFNNITGQRIDVPAGNQGYFPVLFPNPVKFYVNSTGGVDVRIQLLNVPLSGVVFNADPAASFTFNDEGALVVSDPILEDLINDQGSGNGLDVNVISGGSSGGGIEGLPITQYAYTGGFLTLLSATGAGARYRLTGIRIDADPTIFDSSSGDAEVTWVVQQSTTRNLFQGRFWLPKIAPSMAGLGASGNPAGVVPLLYATNFQDVGTVNNEVLRFNIPNAFSGGSIYISVWGEANYVPV